MKDEQFRVLKRTKLLEDYVKTLFLIDFVTNSWLRWMGLLENATESINVIDNLIEKDNNLKDYFEDYKLYYEEAVDMLQKKISIISDKLKTADDKKQILFAEICRRNLNYDVSRYKEIMELRSEYYYKFIEGDI